MSPEDTRDLLAFADKQVDRVLRRTAERDAAMRVAIDIWEHLGCVTSKEWAAETLRTIERYRKATENADSTEEG